MSHDHDATNPRPSQPWDAVRVSLHGLNVRAMRLAIALRVSLNNAQDVDRVLQQATRAVPALERRSGPDRRAGSRSANGSDRRVGHLWEELRGLLVLRYGVQKRCLEDFGIDATRRMVAEVLADLQREGFDPAAAGIDLQREGDPA